MRDQIKVAWIGAGAAIFAALIGGFSTLYPILFLHDDNVVEDNVIFEKRMKLEDITYINDEKLKLQISRISSESRTIEYSLNETVDGGEYIVKRARIKNNGLSHFSYDGVEYTLGVSKLITDGDGSTYANIIVFSQDQLR